MRYVNFMFGTGKVGSSVRASVSMLKTVLPARHGYMVTNASCDLAERLCSVRDKNRSMLFCLFCDFSVKIFLIISNPKPSKKFFLSNFANGFQTKIFSKTDKFC